MLNDMTIQIIESHSELEELWGSTLLTASEKGYPILFDDMKYWVLSVGDEAVAHTASLSLGHCIFVGNTYVRKSWRSKGLHKHLLRERNDTLGDVPKITILNPIQGIEMPQLESVVSSLGYTKVNYFEDVEECMDEWLYEDICHHNVWRLD
tara:strand:+ start:1983 stop:2435 length:453 start_codon:yes stop_codon:yes gene_type:complete